MHRYWYWSGGVLLGCALWVGGAVSQAPVKLAVEELRLLRSGGANHVLRQYEAGGVVTSQELTSAALGDGESLVHLDEQQTLSKKRVRLRKRALKVEGCEVTLPNPTQVEVATLYLREDAPACDALTFRPPSGSVPDEMEGFTLILSASRAYTLKWPGQKWGKNSQGLPWPTTLHKDANGFAYYKIAWNSVAEKYLLIGQMALGEKAP